MNNSSNHNNNPSSYPHHSHSHPPHPHSSQNLTYYVSPVTTDNNLSYTFPQRPSSHHYQQSSQQTTHSHIQAQRTTSSGRTDTGAWPCLLDGCNKVFAREADLKRHQRTTKSHSIPGSSVANPCPLCEATFTRSDAMRRHLKSRHQGKTPETLNLPADGATGGPSSSNSHISSGASSSRGANRRAYSPSAEDTSELSASDSERQPYHHHGHGHGHGHHHQTSSSSAAPSGYGSSSSRNAAAAAASSSSYYSPPPLSPTSPTSTSSSSNPASAGSSHHGMHHHHHPQDANNLSHHVLYQAANNTMSYEIQHALSSPRQPHASHHPQHQQQQQQHHQHQHQHHHSAPSTSSSSTSSRRDTTAYGSMHPQQAVSMPMQPHSHSSSYTNSISEHQHQEQQHQQYPAYQQTSYPAYTGGSGSNSVYHHGNPYIGTANRATGGSGGGSNYTMMSGSSSSSSGGGGGQTWTGKMEDGIMDDGRGGGMSPTRQQSSMAGGLAALAMHASRVRPMSPLGPGKPKSSTKSELENALGPAGVYRR